MAFAENGAHLIFYQDRRNALDRRIDKLFISFTI